jgi:hypothetical protein
LSQTSLLKREELPLKEVPSVSGNVAVVALFLSGEFKMK